MTALNDYETTLTRIKTLVAQGLSDTTHASRREMRWRRKSNLLRDRVLNRRQYEIRRRISFRRNAAKCAAV